MGCQLVSAILAAAVASGRLSYSRVTAGPVTMISPISLGGSSRASASVAMGVSVMAMILIWVSGAGRPMQAPDWEVASSE